MESNESRRVMVVELMFQHMLGAQMYISKMYSPFVLVAMVPD